MNVYKLGKILPGSLVCNANNTKTFYRVIEHKTIFVGHDLGYGYGENDPYAYGETEQIVRCKNIENGRVYRYPTTKKVWLLESPSGDIPMDVLRNEKDFPVGAWLED